MRIYAERKRRLTRQLIADATAIAWSVLWIWVAITVYGVVKALAAPGKKLESAGVSLAADLAEAQSKAQGIPLVGESVGKPFGSAANAAETIAEAGRTQQSAVGDLATVLAVLTAGVPILLALALWIPLRLTWIRAASIAAKLRKYEGGSELLALRALATAPLRRLAELDSNVVAGWRNGDPQAVEDLAALELGRLGLRVTPKR
ncbi:hypothetical protein F4553_002649 [Allocatelliglobosispora scoriae]|uniref:Transmembrane protein n=1 Tax=Allocatelliglobosispora scoriae TaxID=643052 RepID=A0A841BR28_9ACTN|nr:hypothetical protein [Allocatelliglobosispora scoriae]MBB5869270.1 hypothetical protein [Allocatelliglobosispora scoriae]